MLAMPGWDDGEVRCSTRHTWLPHQCRKEGFWDHLGFKRSYGHPAH